MSNQIRSSSQSSISIDSDHYQQSGALARGTLHIRCETYEDLENNQQPFRRNIRIVLADAPMNLSLIDLVNRNHLFLNLPANRTDLTTNSDHSIATSESSFIGQRLTPKHANMTRASTSNGSVIQEINDACSISDSISCSSSRFTLA